MRVRRTRLVAVATLTTTAMLVAPLAATAAGGGADEAKAPARAVKVFPDAPQGFAAVNAVNAADTTAEDAQVGTSLAVDEAQGNVAVAFDDGGSAAGQRTGIATSSNGGLSFVDRGGLPTTTGGDGGATSLAYGRTTGRIYAASAGGTQPEKLQVYVSGDSGRTFGAPTQAAPLLGAGNVEARPSIAVDNGTGTGTGNVYTCWTHSNTANEIQAIYFGRSTDDAATFTPGTGLTIAEGEAAKPDGCQVVVGADHSIYVFYLRNAAPLDENVDNAIFMRRSTDRGATFAAERQVADVVNDGDSGSINLPGAGLATSSFPRASISPAGLVVVTYNDLTSAGRVRSFYVRSTSKGSTWSAPAVASDETTGSQYYPTVAFADDGQTLMFGYYSTAGDPTGAAVHRQSRIATVVGNKTLSLKPSFQLGPDTPIPGSLDAFSQDLGGHDEITSYGGRFFSTWADARTGNAFHSRQLDVRFARVEANPLLTAPAITLTAPATATEGDAFTMTARATNGGGNAAQDVFVRLTVPTGLVVQSVVANGGGRCYQYNRFVGCYLGVLPDGGARVVTLTGVVTGTKPLTTTAAVTTSSVDTSAGDNSAQATITATADSTASSSTYFVQGPVDIPDAGEVSVDLPIPDDGGVLDVSVGLRITHTFDSDLDMYLVSPEGTVVELSTDNGASGHDYGTGDQNCLGNAMTTFTDSASRSVVSGTAPFTGSYRPETPLAAVAGQSPQGVWFLRIVDDAGEDVGTLDCLRFTVRHN